MEALPVTRSSKRIPRPTTRSAWSTTRFDQYIPCIPSIPRLKGWLRGKLLSPSRVLMTGMPVASANSSNSQCAWELRMPCPAMSTGRSASLIRRAACSTPAAVSSDRQSRSGGRGWDCPNSASSNCTSRGTSISTGPGRPSCASRKASWMVGARSAADMTR